MKRHLLETYQQLSRLRPERGESDHNLQLAELIERVYGGQPPKKRKNPKKEGQKA